MCLRRANKSPCDVIDVCVYVVRRKKLPHLFWLNIVIVTSVQCCLSEVKNITPKNRTLIQTLSEHTQLSKK